MLGATPTREARDRIEADTAHATFAIDGKTIATLERAQVAPEGHFEFRVGRGVNIHVVRLDVTHRLAPPPAPKRPM